MPASKDKAMQLQSVYYGDCVKHLEQWNARNFELLSSGRSLADLIYLDPPWNSNRIYNITVDKGDNADQGFTAQATAFTDIWEWDDGPAERVRMLKEAGNILHVGHPKYPLRKVAKVMESLENILPETGELAYLAYMAERLAFCRELLKDTGSIYLHCDPTMSHYLKLVMDAVFGMENFRNEIIWKYNKWTNACKYFQRNHDIIFFYSKSHKYTFNKLFGMTPHKMKVEERGWDSNKVKVTEKKKTGGQSRWRQRETKKDSATARL